MKTSKEYNGHKNYNHWNVSLWINNDEGLYDLALSARKNTTNLDHAVIYFLESLNFSNIEKNSRWRPLFEKCN